MSDLPVVAVLTAKPGSEDEVRQALASLVAPTREEPGCLAYSLYASASDPTVFVTVESWKSQADLDAHMHTDHVQQLIASAGEHLGAAPAIHALVPIDVSG